MKYYQGYELIEEIPTGQKVGQRLGLHISNTENPEMKYYFFLWDTLFKDWDSINLDYDGVSFTFEQIQNKKFFKPIGNPKELILPFPTKKEIVKYYYLIGENRLVADVDQVRLINPIFYSDEFYNAVYNLLKKMYNTKYNLK